MGYRSRVYRTTKLKDGRRIVSSVDTDTWIFGEIIKLIFKLFFYILFFWIIIPIKILKHRKR